MKRIRIETIKRRMGFCSKGNRIVDSWHRSAGSPQKVTAKHVLRVAKLRNKTHPSFFAYNEDYIIRVFKTLLTKEQCVEFKRLKRSYLKRNPIRFFIDTESMLSIYEQVINE